MPSDPILLLPTRLMVFLHYQLKETLWEAISADAARWLLLAIQLENGMIFKEAYIHIAGCYPAWPWSVSQSSFSTDLLESVEIKSSQLTDKRRQIDFKLMLLTIACSENPGDPSSSLLPASATLNSTTWIVVNIWRDWVVNHLAALEDDTDGRATPTALCTHPDDGECLTVAGFYRRIDQHQYLAPDVVLRDWNRVNFRHTDRSNWKECVEDNLHHLKNAARDLVAPLVETNTNFKGIVDYLTCVEFDEEHLPWGMEEVKVKEAKIEEDGKDSVMGGVL
uniref:Uncharacterized protein n=1 Tax=Ramularia collo-cygni TaxID=112498 RepID=A0A2D3VJT9_9PEZI